MCAVLQIRTRKFTICVDEVQYMIKKAKEKHFRSIGIASHNFLAKEGCTQCKMCTPVAQNYDECSAHRSTKAVHTRTLRKKDTKEEKQ